MLLHNRTDFICVVLEVKFPKEKTKGNTFVDLTLICRGKTTVPGSL